MIVRRILRRTYRHLNRDDYAKVVSQFAPTARVRFHGEHELGGDRRGPEEVEAWFKRIFELFPDLRLEVDEVLVGGWPWDTRVAAHFRVRATLRDGTPYENEGMQLLQLRWGRVVDDQLFEDTQKLVAAIEEQHTGSPSAAAT